SATRSATNFRPLAQLTHGNQLSENWLEDSSEYCLQAHNSRFAESKYEKKKRNH
ncbi:unnamed protein product, partial [Ceratitis capitata]